MDLNPRFFCPWDSPSKNTGVGCHAPLQGIFPTQGSNLSLLRPLHSRWILYHYHHQGSPLIGLEISVYWDTPLLCTTDSGLSVSSLTDQGCSISSPPASCGWHGIGRERQWKRWRGAAWFWTPGLKRGLQGPQWAYREGASQFSSPHFLLRVSNTSPGPPSQASYDSGTDWELKTWIPCLAGPLLTMWP